MRKKFPKIKAWKVFGVLCSAFGVPMLSRQTPCAKRPTKAFTLVELLLGMMILVLLIGFASAIYTNFFNSLRNLKATNVLYQETRFTLERIAHEVRNSTVDYEEYFDKSSQSFGTPATYGDNYCKYSRQFYAAGPDGNFGTRDDKQTGKKSPTINALNSNIQDELYLIDSQGKTRVYLKRIKRPDSQGNLIGQIGMIKLVGQDFGADNVPASPTAGLARDEGEGDGYTDSWVCHPDFISCNTHAGITLVQDSDFIAISPIQLDVTELKFIIAPRDDPRKGFADLNIPQIQPHVTIKMSARASKRTAQTFKSGSTPNITLESTISSRVYNEVVAQCVLSECNSSSNPVPTRSCPLSQGVCAGTRQTCSQNVWPGCTAPVYNTNAQAAFSVPYEAQREQSCTDRLDNDCDGLADEFDPDCIQVLCNNGRTSGALAPLNYLPQDNLLLALPPANPNDPRNQDERCLDVGGICNATHPYEALKETVCDDGYDNDCDNEADEFDPDCISKLCSNGRLDNNLIRSDWIPRNWVIAKRPASSSNLNLGRNAGSQFNQDESAPDIGGLCGNLTLNETGSACFDGLDNDGDTEADELDSDCQSVICSNRRQDCDLAPPGFLPANNLTLYGDAQCNQPSPNDELCQDAGGLCGSFPEDTLQRCTDGIDNDCSGQQDLNQRNTCCPDATSDQDGDSFKVANNLCQPAQLNPPQPIDCDDNDIAVNPRAAETGNPLCSDNKDNNCNGQQDSAETACCTDLDGDGYGVATNLFSCRASVGVTTPQADCNDNPGSGSSINPGRLEICDNQIDDDCDGLQDLQDDYCYSTNQLSFTDNLSTRTFASSPVPPALPAIWDGVSGQITNPNANAVFEAVSSDLWQPNDPFCQTDPALGQLGGVSTATLTPDDTVPAGASITYFVSNDQGANWQTVLPGQQSPQFQAPARRQLVWRAQLQGNGQQSPVIRSIRIDFNCR